MGGLNQKQQMAQVLGLIMIPTRRQPNKPMVVVSSVNIDRAGKLCLAAS